MRTWQIEAGIVGIVLASVVIATGGQTVEWLGATAVLLTFFHAQVSQRLMEKEKARHPDLQQVKCYQWLGRYFLAKEICWFGYFVLLNAWSALIGVGIFLIYPFWRNYHVGRKAI